MKKFLRKILALALLFFVVEKVFIPVLYISPKQEVDKRLEDVILGKMSKDIIITGSSRAARSIIAGNLEKALGKTAFNLSYPGADLEFQTFMLKSVLKFNKAPSVFILVVDNPTEFFTSSLKFRFDRLYPLARYDWINDEMILRGEKNQLSKIFALARLNRSNFFLWQKKFTKNDTILKCGSMPISFQRTDREFEIPTDTLSYDISQEQKSKIEQFNEIQTICRKNGIKLVLVSSPSCFPANKLFEKRAKEIAFPGTKFFSDQKHKTEFLNQNYYYDEDHMKTNGATIFTEDLAEWLKKEVLFGRS